MSQEIINTVAAIAQIGQAPVSCATFIVAVTAAPYGVRQLAEMSRARALAAWIEINALWQADEEWREFIYKLSEPPGKLSDENQRRLERGLRHLNYVGLLADKRYFPLADFIESNYFPLLKIWCKSKPYILYERIRKGQDWLRYIDWLCGQAEDYRKRHRPSEEVKIYP